MILSQTLRTFVNIQSELRRSAAIATTSRTFNAANMQVTGGVQATLESVRCAGSTVLRSSLRVFLALACALALLLSSREAAGSDIREVTIGDAVGLVRQNRGNIVMFHLYASWCGPCRREFPDVNRVGIAYAAKGVVLLAFSVDQDPRSLAEFLGDNRYSFEPMRIVLEEPGVIPAAIRTIGGNYQNAIPYTAIFDRSGNLVKEWSGGNNFQLYAGIIDRILADTVPQGTAPGGPVSAGASSGATFTVKESAGLRIAERKGNMCLLTRDGKAPRPSSDDTFLMIGTARPKTPLKGRRKFAEQRLMSTGSTINVSIVEGRDVRIDGIDGFEFVADAIDTDINQPVVIYQVVLFDKERYYLMQGFGRPAERKECLEAFRGVAGTFRRK